MPAISPAANHLARTPRLIHSLIERLGLDLRGATVLTEAGTQAYAVTPALAAVAGAEVIAIARDSYHASAAEATRQTRQVLEAARVAPGRVRITTSRAELPHGLDIITNLGHVRPVDDELLGRLSPAGVVPDMCEAWEQRPGDVDLTACDRLGVPVAGVWEDFEGLDVFRACGPLCVKICFEAGLEVAGNTLVLVGADRFSPVIAEALRANLAEVRCVRYWHELRPEVVADADAVIFADYVGAGPTDAGPAAGELAAWQPGLRIVQFAGGLDYERLTAAGLALYPDYPVAHHRMALSLSHLGIGRIAALHALGLKAGELLWRARRGEPVPKRFRALLQPMNPAAERLLALDSR